MSRFAAAIVLISTISAGMTVAVGQDAVPPPPVSGHRAGEYLLRAGDELEVRALNIPEITADVKVRPDGMISLVPLDDFLAAGKSAMELSRQLSDAYATRYRNPKVVVIVKDFVPETVFVGGEVDKPASIPLHGDLTAMQAVMKAGGFKGNAQDETITVVHQSGDGTTASQSVKVADILGLIHPDIPLEPSDLVMVPKSSMVVYVGGEVTRPGMVPLSLNGTILAAIVQAGGFRETAKSNGVILLRDSGHASALARKLSLSDVMKPGAQTQLKPFDMVFVPQSRIAKIDKFVDQYLKQTNPATLSMGFSYLLGSGGAITTF